MLTACVLECNFTGGREGRREGRREGGRDQERDQNPVASWAEGLPRHRRRKPYYQTHLGRGDVLQPRAVIFPYLLGHTTSFLTEPLA